MPANAIDEGRFNPWVEKIPWRRKWQLTPVFLSGKPHGQSILVGYSPWGQKQSDTTYRLNNNKSYLRWWLGLLKCYSPFLTISHECGSLQFSSVAQPCPTLCNPMNHRCAPGLPVHHQLPEFTQTHVHRVGDAIQPSHPLLFPSPALNPSQHQSLF